MKKKVLFKIMAVLTLGLMIGFTSCKDDDDKDDAIVGKWTFSSINADIENPHSAEAVQMIQQSIESMKPMMNVAVLDVKSDKTFTFSAGGVPLASGKYTEKDGKYNITVDGGNEMAENFINSSSAITVKDNTLTIFTNALNETYQQQGFTKFTVTMTLKK